MDALELKGKVPGISIFLYLMKSRLLLLNSDDPINSLP